MTQKELLYLEDAIGHENSIISICNDSLTNIEDEDLKEFMSEQIKEHEILLKKLMNELEGLS